MIRGLLFGLIGALFASQVSSIPNPDAQRRQYIGSGYDALGGVGYGYGGVGVGVGTVTTTQTQYVGGSPYVGLSSTPLGNYYDLANYYNFVPYTYGSTVALPIGYQAFIPDLSLISSYPPSYERYQVVCDILGGTNQCYYYYY